MNGATCVCGHLEGDHTACSGAHPRGQGPAAIYRTACTVWTCTCDGYQRRRRITSCDQCGGPLLGRPGRCECPLTATCANCGRETRIMGTGVTSRPITCTGCILNGADREANG